MKLGIMQPYFVPYIGYWQRIKAVDKHVIYDDVNFIKNGWINRNRIMIGEEVHYFNLPMMGASSFKLINQIGVQDDVRLTSKMIRTLEQAYSKAPYYKDVMPLLESIITFQNQNLAQYLTYQLVSICSYLSIDTELVLSSTIPKDNSLRAQDKVISICNILGADKYYNASSGRNLYSKCDFTSRGIQLVFLEANEVTYTRFNNIFENNLSIIDVMMFCSKEEIDILLDEYSLS